MQLDATMSDFMSTEVATLSEQAAVEEAVGRVQQGQVVVVLDNSARPIGIVTDDTELQTGHGISLGAVRSSLVPPTITRPDTPLRDALGAARYDPSIRWYVVMREDEIVGIASLYDISATLLGRRTRGDTELFGNVQAGSPNLCYRCSSTPQHQYPPEAIERRNVIGQPLCLVDQTVMLAHIPCDERTG